MLELNSLKLPHLKGTYYSILFQRVKFILTDVFYPQYLDIYDRNNVSQYGRIKIKFCMDWFTKYTSFFADTNYIVLTQYKQIVFIPYLLRIQPNIQIIATNLMYELINIYIKQFQSTITQINIILDELPFEYNNSHQRQSQKQFQYQEAFNINFKDFWTIFSNKQIEAMLKKIIKINYHEIYNTQRGIVMTPYSSGKNNGSCLWSFTSLLTKDKFLLINDISQHQWRTNPTYNIPRLQQSENQKPYDYIIFTERALARLNNENQDIKTAERIKLINKNLNQYINTILILNDETFAIDLISRINVQPEGKCQLILFSSKSFHQIINYCNSYVDYLSEHFKSQIYQQVPDFPLCQYCRYLQKGFIGLGGLQQVSIRHKLPIKQMVLQKTPMLIILKDYEYKLNVHNLELMQKLVKYEYIHFKLENNFNKQMLTAFLAIFSQAKIITFESSIKINCQDLQFNHKYILPFTHQTKFYINTSNLTSSPVHKYSLMNNQLKLKAHNKEYLLISKKIMQELMNQLINKGISIIQKDKSTLKTQKSHLQLINYKLKLSSSSIDQIIIIQKYLSSVGTPYILT